jgi:hypothetical protein
MPDSSPALEARRARVARIRRRVIGGASGLFLVSTGAIVVQLVSGHDPALAHAAAAKAAATSAVAPASLGRPSPSGQGGLPGHGPPGGWHRHDGGGWGSQSGGGFTDPNGSGTGQASGAAGGQSPDAPPQQQVAPLTTHQS